MTPPSLPHTGLEQPYHPSAHIAWKGEPIVTREGLVLGSPGPDVEAQCQRPVHTMSFPGFHDAPFTTGEQHNHA